MLEIKNGFKKYGDKIVLQDINLKFEDGKMYGITGVNGSGKTLISKALTGYIKLTEGTVSQDGEIIRKNNNYIKDAGIIIENPVLVNEYTVEENLQYLKKMSKNKEKIDLEKWYEFFGIEEYKNTLFSKLSLGTKQKVGLIQAFMHKPHNLILDEPFNALDKATVEKVQKYLLEEKDRGCLIIFITHINDSILDYCDNVIEVENGKIVKREKSNER